MAMARDWSSLPDGLLALIFDHLKSSSPQHHLIFRSVCSSWRSATFPAHPLPPFVAFHHKPGSHSFSRLVDHNLRPLARPPVNLGGAVCCGSSHGWLIFIQPTLQILLFNPVTTARIVLPSVTHDGYYSYTISGNNYIRENRYSGCARNMSFEDLIQPLSNKKIILSCDPSVPGSDCVVLAIFPNIVVFCRLGDSTWTSLETPLDFQGFSMDSLYHNGELYVADKGVLYVCRLETRPRLVKIASAEINPGHSPYEFQQSYLVDCAGDLLLIGLGSDDLDANDEEPFVVEICPFKYDQREKNTNMLKMKPEEALGNHVVFLGQNHAYSIPDPRSLHCRGNCIYLSDYKNKVRPQLRVIDMKNGDCEFFGDYNVEDRERRRSGNNIRVPTWFVPNLLRASVGKSTFLCLN